MRQVLYLLWDSIHKIVILWYCLFINHDYSSLNLYIEGFFYILNKNGKFSTVCIILEYTAKEWLQWMCVHSRNGWLIAQCVKFYSKHRLRRAWTKTSMQCIVSKQFIFLGKKTCEHVQCIYGKISRSSKWENHKCLVLSVQIQNLLFVINFLS